MDIGSVIARLKANVTQWKKGMTLAAGSLRKLDTAAVATNAKMKALGHRAQFVRKHIGSLTERIKDATRRWAKIGLTIIAVTAAMVLFRKASFWMRQFVNQLFEASGQLEVYIVSMRKLIETQMLVSKYGKKILDMEEDLIAARIKHQKEVNGLTDHMTKFMSAYAQMTPARIPEIMQATILLKAFHANVYKSLPALHDWAAAIEGGTADLQKYAAAFGKIITGSQQTARLLASRGLQIREFNEELMRTGNREQALINIINKHYKDMAITQATTWIGFISNLKDAFFFFSKKIGEKVFEYLRGKVRGLFSALVELHQDADKMRVWGDALFDIFKKIEKVAVITIGVLYAIPDILRMIYQPFSLIFKNIAEMLGVAMANIKKLFTEGKFLKFVTEFSWIIIKSVGRLLKVAAEGILMSILATFGAIYKSGDALIEWFGYLASVVLSAIAHGTIDAMSAISGWLIDLGVALSASVPGLRDVGNAMVDLGAGIVVSTEKWHAFADYLKDDIPDLDKQLSDLADTTANWANIVKPSFDELAKGLGELNELYEELDLTFGEYVTPTEAWKNFSEALENVKEKIKSVMDLWKGLEEREEPALVPPEFPEVTSWFINIKELLVSFRNELKGTQIFIHDFVISVGYMFQTMVGDIKDAMGSLTEFMKRGWGSVGAVITNFGIVSKQIMQSQIKELSLWIASGKISVREFKRIWMEHAAMELASYSARAGLRALWELAQAFASLAVMDFRGAALHFQSAALFGAISAAAGFAAAGLGRTVGLTPPGYKEEKGPETKEEREPEDRGQLIIKIDTLIGQEQWVDELAYQIAKAIRERDVTVLLPETVTT